MSIRKIGLVIESRRAKPIAADVHYRQDGKAKPVIIFSHGFKGFKDWGCWDLVAAAFAVAGFVFVKFNFSHNGTTLEQPTEFADLEAFGNNNFTIELEDLSSVIDKVVGREIAPSEIDVQNICLVGHSRGGGTSIIAAKENSHVKKLVTWSSVAFFDKLFPKDIDGWEQKGVFYTANARTGQQMPLYFQLYEDLEANEERFDILDACIRVKKPFMIIHGTNDEAVHYSQAMLLKRYAADAELIFIENAGHTFGMKHPCGDALPAEMSAVIEQTISFLHGRNC